MTSETIKTFLSDPDRKAVMSLFELERLCGIPKTTLSNFLAGRRGLNDKYIPPLANLLCDKFGLTIGE